MKAKKKPLETVEASALLPEAPGTSLSVLRAEVPSTRAGGRNVADAAELVDALREQARVL
jgi:electron transfer flavoprotein alpha/beta subunit